jgi:limonene-1,2-epoxide hydrolase
MADIAWPGRRDFLCTALAAAVASGAAPLSAAAAALTEAESANLTLVREFCASWATRDLAQILPRLADDCVYRMTETTPPVTGHDGIRERLGSWMQTSDRIEFTILEASAVGPIVITRRIDRFISTTRPLTWEGVGVFFVVNGKIKEWFDYTIRTVR